jgi:integrase
LHYPLKELREHSSKHNPYVFLEDRRYELIKAKWERWQGLGKAEKWLNSTMLNNFNRQFRVYCAKAGIRTTDGLSQHCLRKAYGTNLANLGTPAHTLQSLMGHSNIDTTMAYYIKSTDSNKRNAIKGLDGLMGE